MGVCGQSVDRTDRCQSQGPYCFSYRDIEQYGIDSVYDDFAIMLDETEAASSTSLPRRRLIQTRECGHSVLLK